MRTKKTSVWSWLAMFVLLGIGTSDAYSQPSGPATQQQEGRYTEENLDDDKLWHSEPILSDLVYGTYGLTNDLQTAVGVNEGQLIAIKKIAEDVLFQYGLLKSESRVIETDENLTFDEKRAKIKGMRFNQRVVAIVNSSDKAIEGILSPDQYVKFMEWTERKYEQRKRFAEEMRRKPPPDPSKLPAIVLPPQR